MVALAPTPRHINAMKPAAIILQLAAFALYTAAVLFWPAGTWAYPAGWTLVALMVGGGVLITAWLAKDDPALLRERMSSPVQRGQGLWDRVFILSLIAFYTVWMAFSAWDAARLGFGAVPVWLQALGALGVVGYMVGAWRTFRENSFAAPVVKLQEGQRVIDTGPYAIVRHPMYLSALLLFIGTPMLLGSWWGLLGSLVLILGIAWRAVQEENLLRRELGGYADYMNRVRFRLVPGVW